MLGTKTPATRLPKWAFFAKVVGALLIAFEAIREGRLTAPTFAQHGAAFETVFPFAIFWSEVGRTLCGEDAGNMGP
jgi:hypothetical protein